MSWTCRLIESPPKDESGCVRWETMAVGDMWFLEVPPADWPRYHLTQHYWAHNKGRAPLYVLLPGLNCFLVDGQGYNQKKGYYDCWTVSGAPPRITVTPSINIVDRYHGHLKKGVITPDVDGRKFDAAGRKVK